MSSIQMSNVKFIYFSPFYNFFKEPPVFLQLLDNGKQDPVYF